jgi:hypothetical protein
MPVKTVSVAQNACMGNVYTMNACATMTTKVAIVKYKRVIWLYEVRVVFVYRSFYVLPALTNDFLKSLTAVV